MMAVFIIALGEFFLLYEGEIVGLWGARCAFLHKKQHFVINIMISTCIFFCNCYILHTICVSMKKMIKIVFFGKYLMAAVSGERQGSGTGYFYAKKSFMFANLLGEVLNFCVRRGLAS